MGYGIFELLLFVGFAISQPDKRLSGSNGQSKDAYSAFQRADLTKKMNDDEGLAEGHYFEVFTCNTRNDPRQNNEPCENMQYF